MSFFGNSSFGSNNQAGGSGFAGFGSNTGGGFGSSSSSPFGGGGGGGSSGGGGLFGNTSSSFGSGGGFPSSGASAFGANQNRAGGFGSGTTTGSNMFGTGNTGAASSFGSGGGFGSGGNTGAGFGSTGGGLFGANKPAGGGFGSNTGGGSAFGSTNTAGFGSGTGGFGSSTGTAFQQAIPPSDGTGSTPFNPFTEKDQGSSQTNHYQSITFQQPYSKYSFEELRLGDYNQGRRYGNGSGQAGGFGAPAFGGGFGSTSGGFGSTSTSSPFGAAAGGTSGASPFGQTQTTGGFGSSAGSNPLFGAAKPAGSLFGGGSGTGTTGNTGGSMFGSANNTSNTSGFGSSAGAGTGSAFGGGGGGSLFGQNNQQQQNKPLFGGTGNTGSSFGGFGQQNTTNTSSPFGGGAASSSPFGGGQQQQNNTSSFGGFGQQNQQNQTQNKSIFGGNALAPQTGTSSLFGNTSGTGNTGSSLFGQNNQQQQQPSTGGSLFGGGTQQTGTGSSLFGGGAQQPAQKSLFGGTGTGTGTGSSPFGGGLGSTTNQQSGTGGSLFGGTQTQQQPKPSLFGGSTNTGGSLFGGQNTAPTNTGGSLFGGTQTQQPQAGGLGTSSLFGGSQQAPAQPQPPAQPPAPGSLQASLLEGNPYGNQSIFSGLPAPSASSPGPLATPLSSSQKQKQRTPLPVYKITPNAANRLVTPPKRQGYGFSYSTYGSPSSNASTPNGLGGSLLGSSMRGSIGGGGSLGRSSFSKSFSTSNLRKTFDPDTDSVLSPGALSSGPSRASSSGLKRLTIDRTLRNDLFTRPSSTPAAAAAAITTGEEAPQPDKLKKKVSFDSSSNANSGGDLVAVPTEGANPTPEELGFLRSIRKSGTVNGLNGIASESTSRPEMELPSVPENAQPSMSMGGFSRLPFNPAGDPQPGSYWMKPTRDEINKLSRDQQKQFRGLTVGRQNCGNVTFDDPVDLTTLDLDAIFGGLVEIGVRKITVYPDESMKPPVGRGLNVASTLRIENSWPRGRDKKAPSPLTSGPLFDKHVDRLSKVTNTEFVEYQKDTGTWVFRVFHYTTYGLDYDSDEEEEEEEGESLNQSTVSAAPDAPTPKARSPAYLDSTIASEQSTFSTDDSFLGSVAGMDDDTFDFKKRKQVPGSFGNQPMEVVEDEQSVSGEEEEEEPFLGDGSTGSTTEQDGDEVTESQQSGESEVEYVEGEEMEMAGTFPDLHRTVEQDDTATVDDDKMQQPSLKPWNTPPKARLDLSGDWAEHLQRTISPRKQDRDALREIQASAFRDRALQEDAEQEATATDTRQKGFSTSIDLMNSLFQHPRKQQQSVPSPLKKTHSVQPRGFELPYNKQPKTFAGGSNEMSSDELAFHHSFKPRWGSVDSLICVKHGMGGGASGDRHWEPWMSVTSEERDIVLLAFQPSEKSNRMVDVQRRQSSIQRVDGAPLARLAKPDFEHFTRTASSQPDQERLIWELANVLFNDDIEDDISAAVPAQLRSQFLPRIKKDRLSRLWAGLIREKNANARNNISSAEERALYLLCSHRVDEACKVLMDSQNLHLATLVSQIGRDASTRADMAQQVELWRQHNLSSEMTEPVRALYELLAGNALSSEGKSGGALEDRSSTFKFSERFELDWLEAFGLRLWYGITEDEPIEAAVTAYFQDLSSGEEVAFPSPPQLDRAGRESPLWVLLKLYANTVGGAKGIPVQEFPAVLLPESVSGDALSHRLSFQLHHILAAAVGKHERFMINPGQADQLTRDYAWELSCAGELHRTIFILLHLSHAVDRERAIRETLARFAPMLPEPVTDAGLHDAGWQNLTMEWQLPEAWIWVSKALYARDTGDAAREVDCLVRAKHWNDAHATFCRIVGPTAVIEQDYETLERLLSGFGDGPDRKVQGWATGGGVYEDYLRLATARRVDAHRLNRLVHALGAMGEQMHGTGVEGLEERVAFKEMSGAVARWTAAQEADEAVESAGVLRLPLTGDARMLQTAEMSRRYYGMVMAGGY